LLCNVKGRESFFEFVRALVKDREEEVAKEANSLSNIFGAGANGWENVTIEHYLESALAWSNDSVGTEYEF